MYEQPSTSSFSRDGRSSSEGPRIGSHAFTQAAIIRGVDPTRGQSGGWWLLIEPDIQIDPSTVLRPDVAGWRRARLASVPTAVIDVVPDWVCEIVTPGEVGRDRVYKLTQYASAGVGFVWLAHPVERTIEAYALEGSNWKLLGAWWDGGPVAVPPFVEQEVDLTRLFVPQADGAVAANANFNRQGQSAGDNDRTL